MEGIYGDMTSPSTRTDGQSNHGHGLISARLVVLGDAYSLGFFATSICNFSVIWTQAILLVIDKA